MKRGLTDIINVMRGSTPVTKVMRGTTLIWEKITSVITDWAKDAVTAYTIRTDSDYSQGLVNPVALELKLEEGTEADYNSALAIYNPNGAYRTGKIYELKDPLIDKGYNTGLNSWDLSGFYLTGVSLIEVTGDKLFDRPYYKMTGVSGGMQYMYPNGRTDFNGNDASEKSIHVKKGNCRYFTLSTNGSTGGDRIQLDFDTGLVTKTGGTFYTDYRAEDAGNGWFKVSILMGAADAANASFLLALGNTAGSLSSAVGDFVYIAHAQTVRAPAQIMPYSINTDRHLKVTGGGGTRINKAGLVENIVYNLVANSNDVTSAQWAKTNMTVSQKGFVSTITDNTTLGDHKVGFLATGFSAGNDLRTVEFKKVDARYVVFSSTWGANYTYFSTIIDLDTVTVARASNNGFTVTLTQLADGWIKASFVETNASTNYGDFVIGLSNGAAATDTNYAGTGKSVQFRKPQQIKGIIEKPYQLTNGTAAYPKIDYSDGTPAFLIEPARTNYNALSNDVNSYPKFGSVITTTSNYGLAPDGTMTADRVILDRTGGSTIAEIYRRVTVTAGTYTISFYAKSIDGTTPTLNCLWNAGYTVTGKVTIGTEWQRYERTITGSDIGFELLTYNQMAYTSLYADLLVWGVQIEQGSKASSLITTGASTVTRTEKKITMSLGSFGSSPFSFYYEGKMTGYGLGVSVSADNNAGLYVMEDANGFISAEHPTMASIITSNAIANQYHKVVVTVALNDNFKLYVDGVLIGSNWKGTRMWTNGNFGNYDTGLTTRVGYGEFNDIRLLPFLTDQEAIELTTTGHIENYISRVESDYGIIEDQGQLKTNFNNGTL